MRSASRSADARLNVMFVDDEPDIRTIVEMVLGLDPAIRLRTFDSGSGALAAIDDGDWTPDLALLDMRMPHMNGLELLAELKGRARMNGVPKVFFTANARPCEVERYRQAGANDVIAKSCDIMTLGARLRVIMDDHANYSA